MYRDRKYDTLGKNNIHATIIKAFYHSYIHHVCSISYWPGPGRKSAGEGF